MAEAAQIKFTIEGQDRNMRRLLRELTKGGDRLTMVLGRVEQSSARAERSTTRWLGGMARQFMTAAGLGSPLVTIIQQLTREWEALISKQREALQLQGRMEQTTNMALLFGSARKREGLDLGWIEETTQLMQQEGLTPEQARETLVPIESAGGRIGLPALRQAGVRTAQLSRITGVDPTQMGQAVAAMAATAGVDPNIASDIMARNISIQRITDLQQSATYMPGAIEPMMRSGVGDPLERLKFASLTYGYLTHGSSDITGAMSATSETALWRAMLGEKPIDTRMVEQTEYVRDALGRRRPTKRLVEEDVFMNLWYDREGRSSEAYDRLIRTSKWLAGRGYLTPEGLSGVGAGLGMNLAGGFAGGVGAALMGGATVYNQFVHPEYQIGATDWDVTRFFRRTSNIWGMRKAFARAYAQASPERQREMDREFNLGARGRGRFPKIHWLTMHPDAQKYAYENQRRLEGMGETTAEIPELFPDFDPATSMTMPALSPQITRQESLTHEQNRVQAIIASTREEIRNALAGEIGIGEKTREQYYSFALTAQGLGLDPNDLRGAREWSIQRMIDVAQSLSRREEVTATFMDPFSHRAVQTTREVFVETPGARALINAANRAGKDLELDHIPYFWEEQSQVPAGTPPTIHPMVLPRSAMPRGGTTLFGLGGDPGFSRGANRLYNQMNRLAPIQDAFFSGLNRAYNLPSGTIEAFQTQGINDLLQSQRRRTEHIAPKMRHLADILEAIDPQFAKDPMNLLRGRSTRAVYEKFLREDEAFRQSWRQMYEDIDAEVEARQGPFHYDSRATPGPTYTTIQEREANLAPIMERRKRLNDMVDFSVHGVTQDQRGAFFESMQGWADMFKQARVNTVNGQGYYEGANPVDGVFQ